MNINFCLLVPLEWRQFCGETVREKKRSPTREGRERNMKMAEGRGSKEKSKKKDSENRVHFANKNFS